MNNVNTQPSEHAMRAVEQYYSDPWYAPLQLKYELAHLIDQHAIAPAVAERGKRIAELEAMVREYVDACYDGGENLGPLRQDQLETKAKALLTKKGQP